jgi:hypothetical protein
MRTTILLLLALAGTAHADRRADTKAALDEFREYGWLGKPEPFEPRVSPTTARWISIATTAGGLGLSAYLWHHASELGPERGEAEMQLASIGTGLLAMSIGPASGLVVAGEYRRSVTGALTRPLVIASGGLTMGLGAFIVMQGCFETDDCTGAKVGGYAAIGAGALIVAAGIGWGIYDIWDTPQILEKRRPLRPVIAPLVGDDRIGIALAFTR